MTHLEYSEHTTKMELNNRQIKNWDVKKGMKNINGSYGEVFCKDTYLRFVEGVSGGTVV